MGIIYYVLIQKKTANNAVNGGLSSNPVV